MAIIATLIVFDVFFGGNFYIPAGDAKFHRELGSRVMTAPRRLVVVCDGFLGYAFQRFWNARNSFDGADVLYVNPKGWMFSRKKRVNAIVRMIHKIHEFRGYDEIVFMGISAGMKEVFDALVELGAEDNIRRKIKGIVPTDPDWDGHGVRWPGKIFRWFPITSGVTGNLLLAWVPLIFTKIPRNPHQKAGARTLMSMLTSQARNATTSAPTGVLWPGLNVAIVRCPHKSDMVLDGDYSSGQWEKFLQPWASGDIPVLTVPDAEHASIDTQGPLWEPVLRRAVHYAFTGRLVD